MSDDEGSPASEASSSTESSPTKMRRRRVLWTPDEVRMLELGVQQQGEGAWASILRALRPHFHDQRTATDLKDKWRNLNHASPSVKRTLRKFILLDAEHRPILNESGKPRVFQNKLPRDAALKIASRDEFYLNGVNEITIYIQEQPPRGDQALRYRLNAVHVFRGTRKRQPVPDSANAPKKFAGRTEYWEAKVVKLREEKYVTSPATGDRARGDLATLLADADPLASHSPFPQATHVRQPMMLRQAPGGMPGTLMRLGESADVAALTDGQSGAEGGMMSDELDIVQQHRHVDLGGGSGLHDHHLTSAAVHGVSGLLPLSGAVSQSMYRRARGSIDVVVSGADEDEPRHYHPSHHHHPHQHHQQQQQHQQRQHHEDEEEQDQSLQMASAHEGSSPVDDFFPSDDSQDMLFEHPFQAARVAVPPGEQQQQQQPSQQFVLPSNAPAAAVTTSAMHHMPMLGVPQEQLYWDMQAVFGAAGPPMPQHQAHQLLMPSVSYCTSQASRAPLHVAKSEGLASARMFLHEAETPFEGV